MFSTALASSPSDKSSIKAVDNLLLKRGYPEDVVHRMPENAKRDLLELNATYVSHKTGSAYKTDVDGGTTTGSVNNGGIGAQAFSNFAHDLVMSKVSPSPYNTVQYILTYTWQWNYQPYWTLEDQISIHWGDSWAIDQNNWDVPHKWEYTAVSDRPCDPYSGGSERCTDSNSSKTGSGTNYSSVNANAGMAFAFDIVNSFTNPAPWTSSYNYTVNSHKGWGRVNVIHSINPPVPGSSNTNVVGKYWHSQSGCTVKLAVGFPASVSAVECSGSVDSTELMRTISW